ncbi:unnamed protein product [Symbiodinium sp. CCMP2456]|nr:unnamed protein product [Symbiodinium sp. CCMP2456]
MESAPSGWEAYDASLWGAFLESVAQQDLSVSDLEVLSPSDLDAAADEFLTPLSIPALRKGQLKTALRQWASQRGFIEILPVEGEGSKVMVFLDKPLGAGGQADVFAGEMSREAVAVKRVSTTALAAKEEAALRKMSDCPQVVKLHHVVKHRGYTWLVLEAMPQGSVAEYLAKHGAMTEDRVAEVVLDVLRALCHAQELAVVHRDIKPENILLAPHGAKLADFGFARHQQSMTSQSGLKGTPMYMSAAALRGEFSHAGDVHALAVCVLVMLKGDHQVYDPSVAFPYEPHYALIAHIQGGNLPSLLPLMSTEAACFVKRCFTAADKNSFAVKKLLEDPWVSDRKPLLQLIPREICAPPEICPPRQTPRDGLQALTVLRLSPVREESQQDVDVLRNRVRSFLLRGFGLHAKTADTLLEQLVNLGLISKKTLAIKDCTDEELAAIERTGDNLACLLALRKAAACGYEIRSQKGVEAWHRLTDLCFQAYLKRAVLPHRIQAKELGRKRREIHEAKLEEQRRKQQREQEQRFVLDSQDRAQRLLHQYAAELPFEQRARRFLRGSDFDFMMSVLRRHPNASSKIGRGVREIYVARLIQLQKEAPQLQEQGLHFRKFDKVTTSLLSFVSETWMRMCFASWHTEVKTRLRVCLVLQKAQGVAVARAALSAWHTTAVAERCEAAAALLTEVAIDRKAAPATPQSTGGCDSRDTSTIGTAPLSGVLRTRDAEVIPETVDATSRASTQPLEALVPKVSANGGHLRGDSTPPPPPPPQRGPGTFLNSEVMAKETPTVEVAVPVLPIARPGGVQWRAAVWPVPSSQRSGSLGPKTGHPGPGACSTGGDTSTIGTTPLSGVAVNHTAALHPGQPKVIRDPTEVLPKETVNGGHLRGGVLLPCGQAKVPGGVNGSIH